MAFWKKSGDPWERKPEKRKPAVYNPDASAAPEEPRKGLLESLGGWNEKRRTAAKEAEEAKRLPPEKCPWCGRDMEQGYLYTGRDSIVWYPGVYRTAWISRDKTGAFRVDTVGSDTIFARYAVAWSCKGCKRMVLNSADFEPLDDPWIAHSGAENESDGQEEMGGE